MNRVIVFGLLCFLSSTVFADELNFTVNNLSKSVVYFKSTDLFDFGTAVNFNETQNHTYKSPPKNIYLSISNGPYESFYMMTDPSCDALGFKPLREMSKIKAGGLQSAIKRYNAGNVYIIISDMPGATVKEKRITCSSN